MGMWSTKENPFVRGLPSGRRIMALAVSSGVPTQRAYVGLDVCGPTGAGSSLSINAHAMIGVVFTTTGPGLSGTRQVLSQFVRFLTHWR